MIIAVATKRKPKIEALKQTLVILGDKYPQFSHLHINQYEIDPGVSETPTTLQELMLGAYNRVQIMIKEKSIVADLYIGMEGGMFSLNFKKKKLPFLQSWVYVSNGKKGFFGASPVLQLPDLIYHEVVEEKRSLSEVTDEFSGKHSVRDMNGTFGILTEDHISRSSSFIQALLAALAPFYSGKYRL